MLCYKHLVGLCDTGMKCVCVLANCCTLASILVSDRVQCHKLATTRAHTHTYTHACTCAHRLIIV